MKISLPAPIHNYFEVKGTHNATDCFADDATVWDNGEDLVLKGREQILNWMTRTVSEYDMTSEVVSGESKEDEFVTRVIVSGNFPGSPYEFENRFKLKDEKIFELAIDPIGPVSS